MIIQFQKLSSEEQRQLLQAPALLSLLASSGPNEVDQARKKDAIKLAHLRTFTAAPILLPYYREVEKVFEEAFEKAAKQYFPFDEEHTRALKNEIDKINRTIDKLDADYAQALRQSLDGYVRHVRKSNYSVLRDVIFPITFSRLEG